VKIEMKLTPEERDALRKSGFTQDDLDNMLQLSYLEKHQPVKAHRLKRKLMRKTHKKGTFTQRLMHRREAMSG